MNKTIRISITIIILVMIISGCSPLYTPVDGRLSKNTESSLEEANDGSISEEETEQNNVADNSMSVNTESDSDAQGTQVNSDFNKESSGKNRQSEATEEKSEEEIEQKSIKKKDIEEEWVRCINYNDDTTETTAIYESIVLGEHLQFTSPENGVYISTIEEIFNKDYCYYKQDGEMENIYATIRFSLQNNMILKQPLDAGLLTNREGDYIPYPVTNYVKYKYNGESGYDILIEDGIEDELESIKRELGMEDLDIVQYYQCDLNNDGQIEKLITINNSVRDSAEMAETWYNYDFSQYINRILLLNQNNHIIQVLDEKKDVHDITAYTQLFNEIGFICDINLDGTMDIIIQNKVYEGGEADVSCFDSELNVLSTDSYYWGM